MSSPSGLLGMAVVLGLTAGIAPGPLLMVVISETMRHGVRAGLKVALAPLLSDAPIILLSFWVLQQMAAVNVVLGGIALIGAGFLVVLGIENWRATPDPVVTEAATDHALRNGVIANVLNPHPYLFWFTVGAGLLIEANQHGTGVLIGFLACFYIPMLGAKMMIAGIVGQSRAFLQHRGYRLTLRILGVLLIGLALLFVKEALVFWQIWPTA